VLLSSSLWLLFDPRKDTDPSAYSIHAGDVYLYGGRRLLNVSRVIIHPNCNYANVGADVALLQLSDLLLSGRSVGRVLGIQRWAGPPAPRGGPHSGLPGGGCAPRGPRWPGRTCCQPLVASPRITAPPLTPAAGEGAGGGECRP